MRLYGFGLHDIKDEQRIFIKGINMDLAIIGTYENAPIKSRGFSAKKHLMKINGEYLIERTIRIARENGLDKVFCILDEHDTVLKECLTNNDYGIPVKLIIQNTTSPMHSLYALAPYLKNSRFCVAKTDTIFDEAEFSEYIDYSLLQGEAAGVLAVSRYADDEKPICIAMDEIDTIIKFSDAKEGYNWATGGLFVFSDIIFDEIQIALAEGNTNSRDFLKTLIARGYLIKGFAFSKMVDVEHISDIKKVEKILHELKK